MSNSCSSESRNSQIIFSSWLKASQRVASCWYTDVYPHLRGHKIVFASSTIPYCVTDNTPVVVFLRNAVPRKV